MVRDLAVLCAIAAAAAEGIAPCDNTTPTDDGSESKVGALNLCHSLQLLLHITAVTTSERITPCDYATIVKGCSESAPSTGQFRDVVKLLLSRRVSRPTSKPSWSLFNAA